VTFGLQSLDDGHVEVVLDNAQGRAPRALSFESVADGLWRLSEGQPFGSATSAPEIAAGVWLPVAIVDGNTQTITSLQVDGNSALATFDGGYQANFTLGGSRSIPNGDVSTNVSVTVKRLAGYSNGLAFYEADQNTGRIEVGGTSLLPGDPGYLQGALANASAANLLIDANRLPGYGGETTLNDLPLFDSRNYGVLLLVDNDRDELYSSYAAANPGGAVQVVAFGDFAHGVTFGIEDILVTGGHSDRDYNDLLVTVASKPL
jgi:hypothetical protein